MSGQKQPAVAAAPDPAAAAPSPGVAEAAGRVRGLVHGRWQAEVVAAVLELGLPDLVGDRAWPVGELAAAARADPDGLDRLLRLATALGLFTRTDAGHVANNAASMLLRADHPRSLRTEARHALAGWARTAWANLEHAVRTGSSGFAQATGGGVFDYLRDHPPEAAAFHAFQAQVTARTARALLAADVLPEHGTVLDVGGGNGTMLTEILRQQPGVRGVVYDRPEVVAAAAGNAAGDRLDLVEGDFFASVPPGADAYVLSHVLHDWPDDRAERILRQVAAAMPAAAPLLVVESVKAETSTNLLVEYLDVLMLTAWGGRERTLGAYTALLARAGLELAGHHLLEPRTGLAALVAHRHTDTSADGRQTS